MKDSQSDMPVVCQSKTGHANRRGLAKPLTGAGAESESIFWGRIGGCTPSAGVFSALFELPIMW